MNRDAGHIETKRSSETVGPEILEQLAPLEEFFSNPESIQINLDNKLSAGFISGYKKGR